MTDDARQGRSGTREGQPYGFEFADAHKESFAALAGSVIFLGVCAFLLATVATLEAVGALVEGYPSYAAAGALGAAVYGAAGAWMLSAGRALSAMLRTRGRDVELLMQAVAQLRRLFALAMALTLLLLGAGMIAGWCAATGSRCWGLFG